MSEPHNPQHQSPDVEGKVRALLQGMLQASQALLEQVGASLKRTERLLQELKRRLRR